MLNINDYVDITLLILLLGAGKLIKSSSVFKKIPNDTIPLILACIGVVLELVFCGVNMNSIVMGIYTALAATGTHQFGKNLFKKTSSDNVLFPINDNEDELDEEDDDENEDEYYG